MKRINKEHLIDAGILALGTLIAWAFAVLLKSSVAVDGSYIPFGMDAFYHAHRILDAVQNGGAVTQFDLGMHVPEGSWVPWPWGFDRLLAAYVQIGMWLNPGIDPMLILVYVPLVWLPVNIGLLLAIFRAIGLRPEFRLLGVVGFALTPLVQNLHGLGAIDHHFMELTFVMLVALCLLRWLISPSQIALAVAVGAALGSAHAIHHGLFILQLPVLGAVFILWLRQSLPGGYALPAMAASLLSTTLLVILPSEPFWDAQFTMATFSWFHLYIAFCTSLILIFLRFKPYGHWSLGVLAVTCVLLAVPASAEILLGTRFLTGRLMLLDKITEMASPLHMVTISWGLMRTLGLYSGLLLLAPALLVAGGYLAIRDKKPLHIGFGVLSVFGLGLLLMQYRLNYFGLCFLLAGPLFFVGQLSPTRSPKRALVFLVALITFAAMYRPPLGGQLFRPHSVAGDHLYQNMRTLYPVLRTACADDPGVVAAAAQFGHYIRFHSDCDVIANHFLLTEQHFEKIRFANSLFHLSVDELRSQQPTIRYVLGFLAGTHELVEGEVRAKELRDIRAESPALIQELMLSDEPSDHIVVLGEVYVDSSAEQKIPLAGVYGIVD